MNNKKELSLGEIQESISRLDAIIDADDCVIQIYEGHLLNLRERRLFHVELLEIYKIQLKKFADKLESETK